MFKTFQNKKLRNIENRINNPKTKLTANLFLITNLFKPNIFENKFEILSLK